MTPAASKNDRSFLAFVVAAVVGVALTVALLWSEVQNPWKALLGLAVALLTAATFTALREGPKALRNLARRGR